MRPCTATNFNGPTLRAHGAIRGGGGRSGSPGLSAGFVGWVGRILPVLLVVGVGASLSAQVVPLWTNSWGVVPTPSTARGNYYNSIAFSPFSLFMFRDDPTIDFDWGLGAPTAGMFADQISVRWNGKFAARFSENHTFYVATDDGCRVWVDNQLVIDRWFDQPATGFLPGSSLHLTAGSVYPIRVEYYENSGAAVIRLYYTSLSQPTLRPVTFQDSPDGSEAQFGAPLAALGGGKFAVGAPKAEVLLNVLQDTYIYDGGGAWIYDEAGQSLAFTAAPRSSLRREYGTALAGFPDGRLLAGALDSATDGVSTFPRVGNVYLHNSAGGLLRSWPNPAGPTSQTRFGWAVAALPGDRLAASSRESNGRVFIFDASQVAPPQVTIPDPTPAPGDIFGYALASFGTNRILIGDPGDTEIPGRSGTVFIYDLSGNLIRKIHNPIDGDAGSASFGQAVVAVDDHRFLVGAPSADVVHFPGGVPTTNQLAGAVYLFDDAGSLIHTFRGLDPARSGNFGWSLAMLGPSRVLIGAPFDQVGTFAAGRVHLFNLAGVHLDTRNNPAPQEFDGFGISVAALDERRFVVGAPYDDTIRPNAGSIYAYDAPLPSVELGSVIPQPEGVDGMGTFPSTGPAVTPPGASFWHVPSQKLFAVKPGGILVSWRLTDGNTNNWEASVTWPTNSARYQRHVAAQASVEMGDGGAYSNVILHATTAGATLVVDGSNRWFTATVPGDSLLMLAPGPLTNSPIRFQFVRSIAWNDPAYLHDNAPATIGEPIVDPAGYHDPACGSPQVVLAHGVYCPAPVFDRSTRTGTIIPVNRDNPANPADDLVVAFYQHGTNLFDAVTGAPIASTICWPQQAVRYVPQWPANPPKIIVASQLGTGAIDPAQFADWQLYYQNDPAQPGFNPNDEHALRLPAGAGEGVFALRDDLATPTTSQPFVLIRYVVPGSGGQWRVKVWRVVAEEAPFLFRYTARAGLLIQAPFPLTLLALAPETTGVSGPYWRDRKLFYWARAAGDDGGPAEIVMRYFYPMQPGFFFPGGDPPPVGSNLPLLDLRAGTPGTPIDVTYDTTWPADVPVLRVGETLVQPKRGLPQIAGQTSAEILYDQSRALGQPTSARLIDPVRTRSVPLAQLPPDVATRVQAGLFHFTTLPPHLENRVTYDATLDRLQLQGEFVEPPAGESYLLLNVLTPRDRAILAGLTADATWQTAVNALAAEASGLIEVPPTSDGFDSLALTAGDAGGTGYLTLAFGNSTNLTAPSDPISLNIIRVACPLYRGELKVIESANPLAEQLTLRHSGDFAGRPDDFEFEWRTLPPVDGLPSILPPEQWIRFQPTPATGIGAVDITISGPGLYTLSDNYFVCRYRRLTGPAPCGDGWSAWTDPMLAEGWIKRVLAGIGPFEQRIRDYQSPQVTQVDTIASMISQAGARAVGDVALNLAAVSQAGLIEVYETVLRRGIGLSIDGAPPVDYPPANDALLLAAGRLADLYMLLGNEAYADAADPTIAFGTDDGVYGSQATSLHCFMNQTRSLLEEELGLLRGRDNSKLPSVTTHPVYNRFIWNFTRDITGGEVAYALNYNIRDVNGDVAGVIDEADAARLYPQGHGDAWGHYLTAIKNYYRLLRSPHFTWVPRIEAVIVGGVPVSVDYLDERKFAAAAAARARTGAEIVNLTFRDGYAEDPQKPWQTQPDTDPTRAWGAADWSSRAGQGALFDWVVATAMLPDVDPNPNHTGIQKIERANVRELPEIAEGFRQVQEQVDRADQGLNPLGLANNVVPFDIDPGAISTGKTHFEQISERAIKAIENAVAVFNHANNSTQLLRRQADSNTRFQEQVAEREADLNNRLIEIFGTPYTDDIGPTGTYPTGYNGPDIYHYDYVDRPEIETPVSSAQPTLQLPLVDLTVSGAGAIIRTPRPVTFHLSPNGFGLVKPSGWVGQRRAPGELQLARLAWLESLNRFNRAVIEYQNLVDQIDDEAELLRAQRRLAADSLTIRNDQLAEVRGLNDTIALMRDVSWGLRSYGEEAEKLGWAIVEGLPKSAGMSFDPFSGLRGAVVLTAIITGKTARHMAGLVDNDVQTKETEKQVLSLLTEIELTSRQAAVADLERLRRLEQLIRGEPGARLDLSALQQSVEQALGRYAAAEGRGLRLLEERTRFRQQTAAQVQIHRYRDMAFRVFRADALQKYRAQFDLAARYAYLTAKAYDYETCLAPGDNRGPGSAFLTAIIRSRSLGLFADGSPLPGNPTGDPGLADPLARMFDNWNLVLRNQLGFSNPQTETGRFSLRNELFRVLTGPAGSAEWRRTLEQHVVANLLDLPEFQRHCIPFSPTQPVEPAIVIPFATTINFGLNFFGWPAGGGDNDYDSTKFATKVRSVGVWFANYNNLGGGMINTPRVYLVPVGLDVMRAPTQGQPYIREWRILDQALPVPFPLGAGNLGDPTWIPGDSLAEDFAAIRRFGRFRAFHDSGNFNAAETISDSRLIGRSVWNTRWLLIIPAGTLHTDRNEGIQRFINGGLRTDGTRDGNGVSDIKIFFQTYAYSGN